MNEKHAYLVWQDPAGRSWVPVGRLTLSADGMYSFFYTKGSRKAKAFGFGKIHGLPEDRVSESSELFPIFANRLMQPKRPEYKDYLRRLNLEKDADPIAILTRSEGRRQTDAFQVIPEPQRDAQGMYRISFFAHGLSHLGEDARRAAAALKPKTRLYLKRDAQNPVDSNALLLRTEESAVVGYCPRFLLSDFHKLIHRDQKHVEVIVEQVNPEPAPEQQRLLCRFTSPWPENFHPFEAEEFQPLPAVVNQVTA